MCNSKILILEACGHVSSPIVYQTVFVEDKYRPQVLSISYHSFILQSYEASDVTFLSSFSTNLLVFFLPFSYCFIIE